MGPSEDQVRERAYQLWQTAGETGSPEDHWLQAEQELKDRLPASVGQEDKDFDGGSGSERSKPA